MLWFPRKQNMQIFAICGVIRKKSVVLEETNYANIPPVGLNGYTGLITYAAAEVAIQQGIVACCQTFPNLETTIVVNE